MEKVELPFGYYDRGSDFSEFMSESKTVTEALNKWGDALEDMVSRIRKLAVEVDGKHVETDKEEEPLLYMSPDLAEDLIEKGLVEIYDEEFSSDDDDDDDDDESYLDEYLEFDDDDDDDDEEEFDDSDLFDDVFFDDDDDDDD